VAVEVVGVSSVVVEEGEVVVEMVRESCFRIQPCPIGNESYSFRPEYYSTLSHLDILDNNMIYCLDPSEKNR